MEPLNSPTFLFSPPGSDLSEEITSEEMIKEDKYRIAGHYHSKPLSQIPKEEAAELIRELFEPDERFFKGFYIYWKEILNMSDDEAYQATVDEVDMYRTQLLASLDDSRFFTVGFDNEGSYRPLGIYGLRALNDHVAGVKLIDSMKASGLIESFPGKLAIAHSFSALNGYRNRSMMKFAFLQIAIGAMLAGYQHIFFFMSDHRLGPIYSRLGLEFPPGLTFQDSKHLVGCYPINDTTKVAIYEVARQFGVSVPEVPAS